MNGARHNGWTRKKLNELGFVGRGRSRNRPRNEPKLYGGPYPFVQTADIMASEFYITSYSKTYSEVGLAQSKMWEANTLCMTIAGENTAETAILALPACFPDSVVGFIADPDKSDVRFVKYALDRMKNTFRSVTKGATQDNLSLDKLLSFDIHTPPLPIQKTIAGILSAYDDLIENNTRRIQILERMAQSLYKEWFVNFRFPGHAKIKLVESSMGKIPQGWEVKHLKDVANVTYGFPFQSKMFNTTGVGTPVIRIRNILDGSTDTFTNEKAEPKYHLKNGDILVGMDGDFHMCIWSSGHAFQNQRVAKFKSNGEIGNYHLFLALELPIKTWNKSIVGTTVAHLGDMHIKTIQFAWPPARLLAEAKGILEPMSEQLVTLKLKNSNLRRTRDLLLPKLISGALDVSKLEIETTG